MSKHTPGPWKVGEWGTIFQGTTSERRKPGIVICRLVNSGAESAANARLIAKAPEMLEVLKLLGTAPGLPAVRCVVGSSAFTYHTASVTVADCIDRARALLKEVEGDE